MSWTYDETALGTSTDAQKLNTVRLLIGDTDTTDQILQNEEIEFSLSVNSNVYYAAALCANFIANKFARLVDLELDGQLSIENSQLSEKYKALSLQLGQQGKKDSLGIFAGGISNTTIEAVRDLTDRPAAQFYQSRFRNLPEYSYLNEDYE